uniref:sugar ABC transporter substrate-binding protein n=1 Tax=Mycolicibacterium obuense TaxID=1807 RepID=UPI003F587DC8
MIWRTMVNTGVILFAAHSLSACQASPSHTASGEVDPAVLAAAQANVEAATSPIEAVLPQSSPPLAADKFVVLITCDQSQPGCTQPALGAQQAAEVAGWRTQLIDGKGTGDQQNSAVQQAIALNPDGIITYAINPETIQGALAQARRQGIKLVAAAATGAGVLDASENPGKDDYTRTGSLLADYAITKTDGQIKALVLHDTGFNVLQPRYDGFIDTLAACPTCAVLEEQTFTATDLANSVPRLTQQMAQRHPDFNTIYVDYDDAVPHVLQGLRALGINDDKIVLSSNGTAAATECIRSGCGQDATTAFALDGIGWVSIDAMNRVFAGLPVDDATYGLGVKLIDHDVAASIPNMWNGDTDYQRAYRDLWAAGTK